MRWSGRCARGEHLGLRQWRAMGGTHRGNRRLEGRARHHRRVHVAKRVGPGVGMRLMGGGVGEGEDLEPEESTPSVMGAPRSRAEVTQCAVQHARELACSHDVMYFGCFSKKKDVCDVVASM